MKIKKYNFNNTIHDNSEGSFTDWHGNYRIRGCLSQEFEEMIGKRESEGISRGIIPERQFERHVIASIIENIKSPDAVFMEVGAGYGEWCLAFHGLVNGKTLDTEVKNVKCIGIESDKQHYEWLRQHFIQNKIYGYCNDVAVSDKKGKMMITKSNNPAYDYGQSFVNQGFSLNTLYGIYKYLMGEVAQIECQTLSSMYPNTHIDLLHIDVQGAECKVLKGMFSIIDNIDYMMIGTHSHKKHNMVKLMLENKFRFAVDISPNSIGKTEIGNVECQDGILVCERKDLCNQKKSIGKSQHL